MSEFLTMWDEAVALSRQAERSNDVHALGQACDLLESLPYPDTFDQERRKIRAGVFLAERGVLECHVSRVSPTHEILDDAHTRQAELLGRLAYYSPNGLRGEWGLKGRELSMTVMSTLLLGRGDPSLYPLPSLYGSSTLASSAMRLVVDGRVTTIQHRSVSRLPVVTRRGSGPAVFAFGTLLERQALNKRYRDEEDWSHVDLRALTGWLMFARVDSRMTGVSLGEEQLDWLSHMSEATERRVREAVHSLPVSDVRVSD